MPPLLKLRHTDGLWRCVSVGPNIKNDSGKGWIVAAKWAALAGGVRADREHEPAA